MSSGNFINYNLRPAKSIERKMITEVIKEICTPSIRSDYKYIGFGASFFTDFRLVHQLLNITNMISIEQNGSADNRKRCEFNKPYNCIDLMFGESVNILPKVDFGEKTIVWLDYDKAFNADMVSDVATACQKVNEDSFLIITCRKNLEFNDTAKFTDEFGDDTPPNIAPPDLAIANSAKTIQKTIVNKIKSVLVNRFANHAPEDALHFQQTFNFIYKDGAEMYTLGGYFGKESTIASYSKLNFNSFDFVKKSEEVYEILSPVLSNKEVHLLNSKLPKVDKPKFLQDSELNFIPKKHLESYFHNYRQFPNYFEVNNQ